MSKRRGILVVTGVSLMLLGADCCVEATWLVVTGNWSNPAFWSTASVPDGDNCAVIDGDISGDDMPDGVEVTFDVPMASIPALVLQNDANLLVVDAAPRSLTAHYFIYNDGVIRAEQFGQLVLAAPHLFQGPRGIIEVVDTMAPDASAPRSVQIGDRQQRVFLKNGILRTSASNDVIFLTNNVTAFDVRICRVGAVGCELPSDSQPADSIFPEQGPTLLGNGVHFLNDDEFQFDREPQSVQRTTDIGGDAQGFVSGLRMSAGPACPDPPTFGVVVPNGSTVTFSGTVTNDYQITVGATTQMTVFQPGGSSTSTITGAGTLVLNCEDLATLGVPALASQPCPSDVATPIAAVTPTYVNDTHHTISGAGLVYGPLMNKGTIVADSDMQELRLQSGYYVNTNLLEAKNGGVLQVSCAAVDQDPMGHFAARFDSRISIFNSCIDSDSCMAGSPSGSAGNLMAEGGIIDLYNVIAVFEMCLNGPPPYLESGDTHGGAISILGNSEVTLINDATITGGSFLVGNGSKLLSGGSLLVFPHKVTGLSPLPAVPVTVTVQDGEVRFDGTIKLQPSDTTAAINLTTTSSILAGRTLEVGRDASIDIQGRVEVIESFTFDGIDDDDIKWEDGSRLVFVEPPSSTVATLEVGGDSRNGGDGNFSLRFLEVQAGASVQLIDMKDNGGTTEQEVLFLDDFKIDGILDCGDIKVVCACGLDPC